MNKTQIVSCQFCCFFKKQEGYPGGSCWRFPPTVTADARETARRIYDNTRPYVAADEWCGEFQRDFVRSLSEAALDAPAQAESEGEMTWGIHCPQCGREDCKWVEGELCDGTVAPERDVARVIEAARARVKHGHDELCDMDMSGINKCSCGHTALENAIADLKRKELPHDRH